MVSFLNIISAVGRRGNSLPVTHKQESFLFILIFGNKLVFHGEGFLVTSKSINWKTTSFQLWKNYEIIN
jgi:hypothetical protein